MATKAASRAALGFRVHTGWAALVAVAGRAAAPTVLERQRIEMIAGSNPEAPPFVYHAAAKLPLGAAERFVQRQADVAMEQAKAAVAAVVSRLREQGYRVTACGMVAANRPLEATLETILGAHPLIHAAEGELFRHALMLAGAACAAPVVTVPARELLERGAKRLGLSEAALRPWLAAAGRGLGKPWGQDQKEALLVALLALM